jgi:hypothetical protein
MQAREQTIVTIVTIVIDIDSGMLGSVAIRCCCCCLCCHSCSSCCCCCWPVTLDPALTAAAVLLPLALSHGGASHSSTGSKLPRPIHWRHSRNTIERIWLRSMRKSSREPLTSQRRLQPLTPRCLVIVTKLVMMMLLLHAAAAALRTTTVIVIGGLHRECSG